jgi:hypothetical protein
MSSEWSDPSDVPIEISTTQIKIGEPLPSTFYPSREALLEAYQSHALGKGYAIVLADSAGINRPNQIGRRVVYKCDRWGKYITKKAEEIHPSKRRNVKSRKTGCKFAIEAQEHISDGRWKGSILHEDHNHGPSEEITSHPAHRRRLNSKASSPCSAQERDCVDGTLTKKRGLPEGYVRGLERLLAFYISKDGGGSVNSKFQQALVDETTRENLTRQWNGETEDGETLAEVWKSSQLCRAFETLLPELDAADAKGPDPKRIRLEPHSVGTENS